MALTGIKAIGFDLDGTLYTITPSIHHQVREEIYHLVAATLHVPYSSAKNQFEETYSRLESGGRALGELGITNGREQLRDCLQRADISRFLQYDHKLVLLFRKISPSYFTFLITESQKNDALKKLNTLGLSPDIFKYAAFWDSTSLRKDTGSIYPAVFVTSGFAPKEHLYCGDSIRDDVLPAKRTGIKTALIGKTHPDADFSLETIYDLERILHE